MYDLEKFRNPQKTMKDIVRFQEEEKRLLGVALPQSRFHL